MAGWFRLYDELLDDPKVQQLPPEDYRNFINLLCLANRNGGFLPEMDEVAFALRTDNIGAVSVVNRLVIATLFDKVKGGAIGCRIAPHGWQKRQYKSDTSTERVKRFRQRSEHVSGNAPEQSRAEQSIPLDKSNGRSPSFLPKEPAPEPDPEKLAFDAGVKILMAEGKPQSTARQIIGKWKRDHGAGQVIEALGAAQRLGITSVVPWCEARWRSSSNNGYGPGHSGVPL